MSESEAILDDLKASSTQAEQYLNEMKALKDVSSKDFMEKWEEFEFWKKEVARNVAEFED